MLVGFGRRAVQRAQRVGGGDLRDRRKEEGDQWTKEVPGPSVRDLFEDSKWI